MGAIIFILVMLGLYFVPSIIANTKKKKNAGAVLALNIFLGWTFIGWIVAFIWAVANDDKTPPVIVNTKSDASDIEKLSDLKTKGVISEEEFQAKKKQILGL